VSALLSYFYDLTWHAQCLSACAPVAHYLEQTGFFLLLFLDAATVCALEGGPLFKREESN
jgi:hypothetical protein